MLDRYLANLSVEPFALCLLQSGWRLTLPGTPVLQGAFKKHTELSPAEFRSQ
jgi:hypothetical protein